jgi:hypothetical protein
MPHRTTVQDSTSHGPVNWWRREWAAPAALALLPWLAFLPVTLLRGVFFLGDVQSYFYPYHVLPASLLKLGELPLWNPFAFSGLPLLADGQTALFYPPNWLFFVLPAEVALSYDILVQFSLAGIGMCLLLRTFGLWRSSAFLGAAVYMFCGCMTARIVHLSILSGAALMPWALWCIELAFRETRGPATAGADVSPPQASGAARVGRGRGFVASAAVIGLQVFAGHPQVPVYTAMMLGLYAFVRGVERWQDSGSPSWVYRLPAVVAAVYLLGGGLAAIQLVPWAELGSLSVRAAGASFGFVFGSSMGRSDWLLQLFPYLYGSLRTGPYAEAPVAISLAGRYVEHSAYVGILPLGLAAYAFFGLPSLRAAGRVSRPAFYSVLFFTMLAILGLLLAVGWGTPLAHIVYRMPVLGKLRAIERALLLVDFAVAGLAAFGFQRLTDNTSPAAWRSRRSLAAIGVGTAALPVAVMLLAPQPWFQRAMSFPREASANLLLHRPNAAVPLLFAFASAALFLWWSRRSLMRATVMPAIALVLLDLGGYAALYHPTIDRQYFSQPPAVLAAFRYEPRPFRKATYLPVYNLGDRAPKALLAMSWGMAVGVEDINGFNSLQTRRYTDYLLGSEEDDISYGILGKDHLLRPESPILNSLNVRYLLVQPGTPARVGSGYRRVWEDPEVVVYENTLAYPRAYFADAVQGMTDASAVRRAVIADGFDGRKLALVEAEHVPMLPAPRGEDAVTMTSWSANRLSFSCTTATARFLVLSEMYFPGWQARVDGVSTPIYRTNYLFRGIVVPAGQHTVTFDYRPRSVLVGAAISGVSLLFVLMVRAAGRRRRYRIV